MTIEDFSDLIYDQECQLLENFLLPTKLIVDLRIAHVVFGRTDFIQYRLPFSGQIVPVVAGKTDQILLMGDKEGIR